VFVLHVDHRKVILAAMKPGVNLVRADRKETPELSLPFPTSLTGRPPDASHEAIGWPERRIEVHSVAADHDLVHAGTLLAYVNVPPLLSRLVFPPRLPMNASDVMTGAVGRVGMRARRCGSRRRLEEQRKLGRKSSLRLDSGYWPGATVASATASWYGVAPVESRNPG